MRKWWALVHRFGIHWWGEFYIRKEPKPSLVVRECRLCPEQEYVVGTVGVLEHPDWPMPWDDPTDQRRYGAR